MRGVGPTLFEPIHPLRLLGALGRQHPRGPCSVVQALGPGAARLGLCEGIYTAPRYRVLVVKQGKKVKSGLSFTDYVAQDFTAADQGRLAPIIALMRMLDEDL